MDVRTAARSGYVLEHLLVQPGHDYVAALVPEQLAVHGYGFAFARAHTYRVDLYPAFRDGLRGCDSVVLVVLAIGYHYYGTALLALGAESARGGDDGIAYRGALDGYRPSVYIVKEHLRRNVVGGNRKLDEGGSGEYDQTYPVVLQPVHQARNRELSPRKPVGTVILREHGIGDVEAYHDLRSARLPLGKLRAYQRTRQANHEEEESQAEQHHSPPALGR